MTKYDRKWNIFDKKSQLDLDLPFWFLSILKKRGIETEEDVMDYLDPKYEKITSFDNFIRIKEAAKRIKKAVKKKEKILVYGDYDVDGITATTLVFDLLKKIGAHYVEAYIPHRVSEGYGLNKKRVESFARDGFTLIIAVDCGIGSKKIVDSTDHVDFIIIDHHKIDPLKIPTTSINIHPSLTVDKKEYALSGCGMAFYFLRTVQSLFLEKIKHGQEKWYLDLVALSTVCDIVPLAGENRILAKWGLKVLSKTKRPGLVALAESAGINLSEIGAYEAGFLIGPRINAAGRIESADLSFELLTTVEKNRAKEVAHNLTELNRERQQLCEKITKEAIGKIEKSKKINNNIYILSSKDWSRGVAGIVASKVSEKYNKPVIIFENDGNYHHGSARSIDGFDIVEALKKCQDTIKKFGGHSRAAGLTVSNDNFTSFSNKLIRIANKDISKEVFQKVIEIDTEISFVEINDEAIELIYKMEPTGFSNPRPVFLIKDVFVFDIFRVGGRKEHIKFKIKNLKNIEQSGRSFSGICFNEKRDLIEGQRYDLVGTLSYNIWNNKKSIEFRGIDFKASIF